MMSVIVLNDHVDANDFGNESISNITLFLVFQAREALKGRKIKKTSNGVSAISDDEGMDSSVMEQDHDEDEEKSPQAGPSGRGRGARGRGRGAVAGSSGRGRARGGVRAGMKMVQVQKK